MSLLKSLGVIEVVGHVGCGRGLNKEEKNLKGLSLAPLNAYLRIFVFILLLFSNRSVNN